MQDLLADANVIPKGLMHSVMFSSIPETGDPEHTTYDLSAEDEQKIKDNNWSTLNICLDWTETEDTLFLPYFYQVMPTLFFFSNLLMRLNISPLDFLYLTRS